MGDFEDIAAQPGSQNLSEAARDLLAKLRDSNAGETERHALVCEDGASEADLPGIVDMLRELDEVRVIAGGVSIRALEIAMPTRAGAKWSISYSSLFTQWLAVLDEHDVELN